MMRKLWLLATILLAAGIVVAQTPKTSFTYSMNDVFAGYSYTDTNTGGSQWYWTMNGVQVAATHNFTKRWAALAQVEYTIGSYGSWERYSAGGRFNLMTGRFRPFLKATAGLAHMDGKLGWPLYEYHSTGFSGGGGGGLDFMLQRHWSVRAEATYSSVPFGYADHDSWLTTACGLAYHF